MITAAALAEAYRSVLPNSAGGLYHSDVFTTRGSKFFCLLVALLGSSPLAYAAVEIEGLGEDLEAHVLAALNLDNEECSAPDWRINGLFQRAPREIRSALESYGYYSAGIQSDLEHGADCWTARFVVTTGEPVVLRDVRVEIRGEAESDPEFAQLVAGSTLVSGSQLRHAEYEGLKSQLSNLARRKGYAEATFLENRIDVYPEQLAADITLEFDSGPRYAFGEIEFRQDILDADLVGGFSDIEVGDPFDRADLTTLYGALVDSGYFGLVDIQPLAPDTERRQIPILVDLTPGRRRIMSYGGGFATDTGPRARITRTNRRVNASGAQLNLNAELSPVVSEFGVAYRFPYGDPRTEWVSFDTGIKHEDTETSKSNTVELGARRVMKRSRNWQETRSLDLLVEDYEIAEEKDRTRLLQPGVSWFRVQADNTIRPDRGNRLLIELSAASRDVGSSTSFLKAVIENRWIRSVAKRSRVLTRIRAGTAWEDDFDELPPSVRFFAGGDNSVRGYEFRSQGPVDADGDVIGGDRLLVGSIEFERLVTEKWSVATFYDAGNAFRDNDFEPVAGFGIGARWLSPLGPIRIDVAKPLDGPDRGLRLHINLGPDL